MIRAGIIGAGAMGTGLAYQASLTPDIHCVAIADTRLDRAVACATMLQRPYRVARTADDLRATAGDTVLAVCEDGRLIAAGAGIDLVLESSSAIAAGGQHAELALQEGKHVVMTNAPADLTFGPYLTALAAGRRATYTSADGDRHGVLVRLVRELRSWGFELVMAGSVKGSLDRYANPDSIPPAALERSVDPKMTAGDVDGSTLAIGMALVANGLGLSAPEAGMTGPRVDHVTQLLDRFDVDAIRRGGPVVDYVRGAQPDGGVFAVGYCDHPFQRSRLSALKMGPGPFYVFYRPYHLAHVEAIAAARDAANGQSLLQPWCGFRTNVFAYAKTDLPAGTRLDGPGGYACYGLLENYDPAALTPGLPLCLAENVTLARPRRKDERLTWSDIDHDPSAPAFAMYARALAAAGAAM